MKTNLNFIQSKPSDGKKLTRGYFVNKDTLSLSYELEPTEYIFGKSPTDVIEFTVYNLEKEKLGWKLISDEPIYENVTLNYKNYSGEDVSGSTQVFKQNYSLVGNDVLVSPSNDIQSLELDRGSYYIQYSFLNNICGSYENETKLVISDISQTRTEIKIVPECLKTSNNPADASLSFEYINLINQQITGPTLFYFTDKFIKDVDLRDEAYQSELVGLVEDYEGVVKKAADVLGNNSEKDVYESLQTIKQNLVSLYKNTLLSKYNSVFTKSDYYFEFLNSINYLLSVHPRLSDSEVDESVINFYKTVLISLFDVDYLTSLYETRFSTYLNNYINFGDGNRFPILSITPTLENQNSEQKHQPCIVKLFEPLSIDISTGSKFYISSSIYSDDVMQKANFYKTNKQSTFKLRGPDRFSMISSSGTVKLTKEELQEGTSEVSESTKTISNYFSNDINVNNHNFSEFKDFVKFSSARKQLEIFIQKHSTISDLIKKIDEIEYNILSLQKKIETNLATEDDANDAISVLKKIDLENYKKKLDEHLYTFTDYERFLFYEVSDHAFPRNEYIYISGITGINELANGRYLKYSYNDGKYDYKHINGNWFIWWEAEESAWILSDTRYFKLSNWIKIEEESYYFETELTSTESEGFNLSDTIKSDLEKIKYGPEVGKIAPDYISTRASEWKTSLSYSWFEKKHKDASYYDRENYESLVMNIPEFITRNEENDEFINMLNMVGLHFDHINGYIENLGNTRKVRNQKNKGIPDNLIYYFLQSLGLNFSGQNINLDGIQKNNISDANTQTHKRNQIWRRILNNLPYILKTKGTLASINALLRCYDIPEQLFSVREYGGATEYSDDSGNSSFTFDTYDYGLTIINENQYIQLPWSYKDKNAISIEFNISFNKLIKNSSQKIKLIEGSEWEFGITTLTENNGDYGRFYIKIGDTETQCPTKSKAPLYMWSDEGYDILIQRTEDFNKLQRKTISFYVKRKVDQKIVFSDQIDIIVDEEKFTNFSIDEFIYIGNYTDHKFKGNLSSLRVYSSAISEEVFENHVLFSKSYSISDFYNLRSSLLFKSNLDYPLDLSETANFKTGYGVLNNSAFSTELKSHARCFNFTKKKFPYDFSGRFKKEVADLPGYGNHTFSNNKIRVEEQYLTGTLNPRYSATKKSLDRAGKDSNTVGLFFGPSVPLNEEIIKFFGKFKLGDYIGDPAYYEKTKYKELDTLKKLFFREGFSKIDWSNYLNTLKSYLDESLFDNFEKLLPARSRIISGLVIEPTLLERTKLKGTHITNEIQTNYQNLTVIESTEKIKPLKNIRLSGRNKNKDIVSFANESMFNGKHDNINKVCLTANTSYKKVSGKTNKESLYDSFYGEMNTEYMESDIPRFGHVFKNGNLYRVEESKKIFYEESSWKSGLTDYTILTKFYLTIKLKNKVDLTPVERATLSSVEGVFTSNRNVNKKIHFINSAKTWFIYYEPYVDAWVLLNKDPKITRNTETLLADGTVIRFYATVDRDGYFPSDFGVVTTDEITKLSGSYTTWNSIFLNSKGTGPLNSYKKYSTTTNLSSNSDKRIRLSGYVSGTIDCQISGLFNGTYTIIKTESDGSESAKINKGIVRFRNEKYKIRLDGKFTGILQRGFVGNKNTNTNFILSDGLYNNQRFGGCYFSKKYMFGDINDIVENHPDNVILNSDMYNPNNINTYTRSFTQHTHVKVPNKVEFKFSNLIDSTRKITIERNSENKIFYEDGVPKRNTRVKYNNKFIHKTKDVIENPLISDIKLNTTVEIHTTELRSLKVIGYHPNYTNREQNKKLEHRIKYINSDGRKTIDFLIKFIFDTTVGEYKCDIDLFSVGLYMTPNTVYTTSIGNEDIIIETDIETSPNSLGELGESIIVDQDILDEIYENQTLKIKVTKNELVNSLNDTNSIILKYNMGETSDNFIYLLGSLDDSVAHRVHINSNDFISDTNDMISYGGVNYFQSYDIGGDTIKEDVVEIRHHKYEFLDQSLDVGESVELEVSANDKLNYFLAVNRELNVDADDDEEAVIYTKDTLGAITTFNINDKFLSYECEIEPILNQAYYSESSSLSKYFLLVGTSEYKGFYLNDFVGRWKSANGQYRRSYRKNKKYSYLHTSGEWLVFYSISKPECKKDDIHGAWVLVKVSSDSYFESGESGIFNRDTIWMYGFTQSEFNGILDTTSLGISEITFNTDYGSGFNETDMVYKSDVVLYENLCKDSNFIKTESTKSNKKAIDSSFSVIPNIEKFEFADSHAINYIGTRNNILAWSVSVKSVENKLPPRAVYTKVYPDKDVDVSIEVSYEKLLNKVVPSVRLLGSNVRGSTFNKIEGSYYRINKQINGHDVFRNAHDFYIYKDVYTTGEGSIDVWAVSDEIISLTSPVNDIVETNKPVFVSSSGACVTDEFYFRLGYDLTPNVYSYQHRNTVVATAFRNARRMNDQDDFVVWGSRRNESACSVCDDNSSSSYGIEIYPEDAASIYNGRRQILQDLVGYLNIEIKCNKLDCRGDLFDFYGMYTISNEFGTLEHPVYYNKNEENIIFTHTDDGWFIRYNVVIYNDNIRLINSKNKLIKNFDLKYEYPKYGNYLSDVGDILNLSFDKNEHDEIFLLSESNNDNFDKLQFRKSHIIVNQRSVWTSNENYFIYFYQTATGSGWCVNDTITDKKIIFTEYNRIDSLNRNLDDVYGIYYFEKDGVIDFDLNNCLVANSYINFNIDSSVIKAQINKSNPDTFSYKVGTNGGTKSDSGAFEVHKLTSSSSNKIETHIPIDTRYSPVCFERDVRENPTFSVLSSGKVNDDTKLKIKIDYLDFSTEINVDRKYNDSFSRIYDNIHLTKNCELIRYDNLESDTSTRGVERHRINKPMSNRIPEINKIILSINLNLNLFRERTEVHENEFTINESLDLVHAFVDTEDVKEIDKIIPINKINKYIVETDYRLCDVNKTKTEGGVISSKKSKVHRSSKNRLFRRNSINTLNTTVDSSSGDVNRTSPIIRTRVVFSRPEYESGSSDSFWFIDDERVVSQVGAYEEPTPISSWEDINQTVRDKLELHYSFNNSRTISYPDTPTPSPSPSPSRSNTNTKTTTQTNTKTKTATYTPTPTKTATKTPTPSESASQTKSFSSTKSHSESKSESLTKTQSYTDTGTPTKSASLSISETKTPTKSKSNTKSATPTTITPELFGFLDGPITTHTTLFVDGGVYTKTGQDFLDSVDKSDQDASKFNDVKLSGVYSYAGIFLGNAYYRKDTPDNSSYWIYQRSDGWWLFYMKAIKGLELNEITPFFGEERSVEFPNQVTSWLPFTSSIDGFSQISIHTRPNTPDILRTYKLQSKSGVNGLESSDSHPYKITIRIVPEQGSSSVSDTIEIGDTVFIHGTDINKSVCTSYENALNYPYRVLSIDKTPTSEDESWKITCETNVFSFKPEFICPPSSVTELGYASIIKTNY
jgi:hypothetical protein